MTEIGPARLPIWLSGGTDIPIISFNFRIFAAQDHIIDSDGAFNDCLYRK